MLECERDPVADAPRMGDLDRLADMEGEVRGRSATTCGSARISAAAMAVCRNTSSGELLRRICAM